MLPRFSRRALVPSPPISRTPSAPSGVPQFPGGLSNGCPQSDRLSDISFNQSAMGIANGLSCICDPIEYVARWIVNFLFKRFSTLSDGTRERLLKSHGYVRGFALFLFLKPAYDQLDRMEDHINWASDDVIEKCRQTYISECNMSAIAVSTGSSRNLYRVYAYNNLIDRAPSSLKSLLLHLCSQISAKHIGSRVQLFSSVSSRAV